MINLQASKKIIDICLNSEKEIKTSELANILGLSPSTVRVYKSNFLFTKNHLKKLESHLEQNKSTLQRIDALESAENSKIDVLMSKTDEVLEILKNNNLK